MALQFLLMEIVNCSPAQIGRYTTFPWRCGHFMSIMMWTHLSQDEGLRVIIPFSWSVFILCMATKFKTHRLASINLQPTEKGTGHPWCSVWNTEQ